MIPFALVALASAEALADPSYRALEIDDGRAFVAEVLATEAGGLRVRTPQGTLALPFDRLRDMKPTDASAWADQPAWSVQVAAPEGVRDDVIAALRGVPRVEVRPVGETGGGLSDEAAARGALCALDVDCLFDAWAGEPWQLVVVAMPEGDGLRLVGAVSTGAVLHRAVLGPADAIAPVVPALLGLEPPASEPATLAKVRPPRAPGRAQAFTPVPGLPALRRGDHAGFLTAVGIAVPTTALWVGAVGRNAQSAPETVALSLAGFYVTTVVVNQLTSPARDRRPAAIPRAD